jgi:hypothetical protein
MNGMASSIPRFLALLGMIGLSLVAAFGVFIGWWALGAENYVPSSEDGHFLGAAVAGFAATLGALAGLAAGSRRLTGAGILGHFGAACYMLVFGLSPSGDSLGAVLLVIAGFFVVDLVATAAIVIPWDDADRAPPQPAGAAEAPIWQRNAALVLMRSSRSCPPASSCGPPCTARSDG